MLRIFLYKVRNPWRYSKRTFDICAAAMRMKPVWFRAMIRGLFYRWWQLIWIGQILHWICCLKHCLKKDKAIPLQAWTGPEGSRQSAHEGGKVVSPTHRSPLPPRKYFWYSSLLEAELTLGSQCGQKDYVNEKFQWYHRESNQRPFGL